MARPQFAYVFERFPSFTQTFCAREVMELQRQGVDVLIFSIHSVAEESLKHFPEELLKSVHVLPPDKELHALVKDWKSKKLLPQSIVLTLREWDDRPDKARIYEAVYIGQKMTEAKVDHAHTHFAGIGARTCWWLKQFYGFSYSVTGHANDMFVETGLPLTLGQLVRDAALFTTVSDFTKAWLLKKFPGSARKIRRVYNGLDIESIANATTSNTKSSPPIIASVGRLIEKKGFDDLIRACAILRDQSVPFHCIIAGEGPLEHELAQQITSQGLDAMVTLAGALPQQEVTALLGRATLFALPCVTERDGGMDNLPTVIMEAMAASLPCVSTSLAGVPEMISDGETGLLTDQRQPADFAAALKKLLEDQALREQMGRKGLARARQLFAQEITARELLTYLVRFGNVSTTPELLRKIPALKPAARAQRWRRFLALLRGKKSPRKTAIFPG